MARIILDFGFSPGDSVQSHLVLYRQVLRQIAAWNRDRLPAWGLPDLYAGHVRYGMPVRQEFPDALRIYERGWADCGPLSAWRLGELWRAGERADIRVFARPVPGFGMLYHATVRRGNGEIEDVSRLLGMQGRAA